MLSLPPQILNDFADTEGAPPAEVPEMTPTSSDDLAATITLAAVDAGLHEPERVNAETLQHSYLAYLVRQGVKLSEVNKIVGGISTTRLASYAQLSPAGPGKSLDEIELAYPLFRE